MTLLQSETSKLETTNFFFLSKIATVFIFQQNIVNFVGIVTNISRQMIVSVILHLVADGAENRRN